MNQKTEKWLPVVGYEDYYQISDQGNIFSFFTSRPIKAFLTRKGYLRVDFKGKKFLVHKLIMETFVGKEPKLQVNHKNGIKTDNRLENLEWTTAQQNVDHAWGLGLVPRPTGSKHPRATITEEDVVKIRVAKITKSYGLNALAKDFNTTREVIKKVRYRQNWKHVK